MERLWAVWRMRYIEEMKERRRSGTLEDEDACFFCDGAHCEASPANLVLFRNEFAMIILNMYPYNPGHLMVAPLRHVASPRGLAGHEHCKSDGRTLVASPPGGSVRNRCLLILCTPLSLRSASIGSNLAARRAGKKPNTMPMVALTAMATPRA